MPHGFSQIALYFLKKIKILGVKITKSQVIPYPVDVDKYKKSSKGLDRLLNILGFSKTDIIILAVGRLVEKKGFEFLIRSLPRLVEKNKRIKLVIVGDGDLKDKLILLTEELGISRWIKFAGTINREEILYYYNIADIFVMPSIQDAMGNIDDQPVSLLEAMACSLPVVATNFPGIALNVKDHANGFLTPQRGVKEIEAALLKLISSKNLRQKMGRESRRVAVSNVSLDNIGTRYIQLFKEVLNSKYG